MVDCQSAGGGSTSPRSRMDDLEFREKMLEIRKQEVKIAFRLLIVSLVMVGVPMLVLLIGEVIVTQRTY